MRKGTIYTDDDMMRYVYEIISLISSGQYHSARTDQIILDCIHKFGDKWIEVIRIMIDFAKNNRSNIRPIECDQDYFDNVGNNEDEEEGVAVTKKFVELSANPDDCDFDSEVEMIDETEGIGNSKNNKYADNQDNNNNNNNDDDDDNNNNNDDDDDDDVYSEITPLNELNEKVFSYDTVYKYIMIHTFIHTNVLYVG